MKTNITNQKQQTRNILKQLLKSYEKCLKLSKEINKPIPNQVLYETLRRQAYHNLETLNAQQLLNYKNQLFLIYNEILDIQQDYSSERQKKKTFKQLSKTSKYLKIIPQQPKTNKMRSSQIFQPQATPNLKRDKSLKFIPLGTPNLSQAISFKKGNKVLQNCQLPIYQIHNINTEEKLDSISKCVASLKRNMKLQIETYDKPFLMDFMKMDPQYTKVYQELQRFKMRQQELPRIIQKQIQKGILKYINNMEVIQQNGSYKIIKITKGENKQSKLNLAHHKQLKRKKRQDLVIHENVQQQPYQKTLYKYQSYKQLNTVKQQKINNSIGNNMKDVLDAIGNSVQFNQQKLKKIRQKRQKMFAEGQDIWDQIKKL